jgi:hypothetical protein
MSAYVTASRAAVPAAPAAIPAATPVIILLSMGGRFP